MRLSHMHASGHSSPMFGLRLTLRWLSRFLPWSRRWLERAGADFMLHCFRRQMKGVYSRSSTWNLPSPLPDLEDTERKFAMEVEKFLQSNQSRLLLHIDEHHSMSDSPEFRRGAMQLAGSVPARCRVIATYLEPPDLPCAGLVHSLQVCNCNDVGGRWVLADFQRVRYCTSHGGGLAQNQASCRSLEWQGTAIARNTASQAGPLPCAHRS